MIARVHRFLSALARVVFRPWPHEAGELFARSLATARQVVAVRRIIEFPLTNQYKAEENEVNRRIPKIMAALTTALVLALSPHAQAVAGEVVASGTFTGKSGHVTKGQVSVLKTTDGYIVELGEGFSLDNAPDPKLAFGKSGGSTPKTFAVLKSNTGAQTYSVPAGIMVDQYDEFYIWCEKFSVPLGRASLK